MSQLEILKIVTSLFTKFNIQHCLGWGTLLGFVREGDFFEKDDVDLAVFQAFWNKYPLFETFVNELYSFGLEIKDASYNYLCIWDNKIHVDVHLMEKYNKDFFVKVTGEKQKFIGETIFPLKKQIFLETEFNVPRNPIEILKQLYGKNWNIKKEGVSTHCNGKRINNFKKITYPFIVSLPE